MQTHRGLHIGLTGGIGSGKSTVARALVERGAVLIDTDAIARSLASPGGDAIEPLRARFGADVIDGNGALDRTRMRELVFADARAKEQLEAILHPMIGIECNRQALAAAGKTIVFDVPLLVESTHWRTRVDRVLVVDCPQETQVSRVMQRSGWSRDAVLAVIAQQATRTRRRACADAVIYNEGLTLDELARHVDILLAHWAPVEQSRGSSGARAT
ncbi:MAG TPA: dephospho-CoA kinase [Rhizobacter sp.]